MKIQVFLRMFGAFLLLVLLHSLPAFACSAGPCADGTTCTGNKSCTCSGGTATCTDYPPADEEVLTTEEGLARYISFLRTVDSADARAVLESAEAIERALHANSLLEYFAARAQHDKALMSLSSGTLRGLSVRGFLREEPGVK